MLTTITFDVWETLLHDPPGAEERLTSERIDGLVRVLADHGIVADRRRLFDGYQRAMRRLGALWWHRHRDVDTPTQVIAVLHAADRRILDRLSDPLLATLADAYVAPILTSPPDLNPAVQPVLAELRHQGYRLGLICNTGRTPGRTLRQLFARSQIDGYFDTMCFSNEVGIQKPDPTIFWQVLRQLGARPDEALHVGDDRTTDIAGARLAGMRAVLIKTGRWSVEGPDPDVVVDDLSQVPGAIAALAPHYSDEQDS